MAKPQLGAKRICPETGRKFYDLNKDPIVSPFTGKSYPRSYFESESSTLDEEELEEKELEADEDAVDIVPLEDADEETKATEAEQLPDLDDDVELDEEEDPFLADEEEEDDDVTDIIGVGADDEEET